jgi:ketosteroid isomerase-like protein
MKYTTVIAAGFAASVFYAAPVMAKEWSDEQTSVWSVVEQSWKDEVAENEKWPTEYVHDDVVSWGAGWPMPRGKDSIAKWSRFGSTQSDTLEYELMPMEIQMAGDTAVVHYATVTVLKDAEDKTTRSSEGLIEVLVKDGETWKFMTLTSFEIGKD